MRRLHRSGCLLRGSRGRGSISRPVHLPKGSAASPRRRSPTVHSRRASRLGAHLRRWKVARRRRRALTAGRVAARQRRGVEAAARGWSVPVSGREGRAAVHGIGNDAIGHPDVGRLHRRRRHRRYHRRRRRGLRHRLGHRPRHRMGAPLLPPSCTSSTRAPIRTLLRVITAPPRERSRVSSGLPSPLLLLTLRKSRRLRDPVEAVHEHAEVRDRIR